MLSNTYALQHWQPPVLAVPIRDRPRPVCSQRRRRSFKELWAIDTLLHDVNKVSVSIYSLQGVRDAYTVVRSNLSSGSRPLLPLADTESHLYVVNVDSSVPFLRVVSWALLYRLAHFFHPSTFWILVSCYIILTLPSNPYTPRSENGQELYVSDGGEGYATSFRCDLWSWLRGWFPTNLLAPFLSIQWPTMEIRCC